MNIVSPRIRGNFRKNNRDYIHRFGFKGTERVRPSDVREVQLGESEGWDHLMSKVQ